MRKIIIALIGICLTLTANAIEFTVMHAPGGVSDIVTRFIVKEIPNKNIVVFNRPGAAGKIAIQHMMTSNTMMLATMPQVFVTNPINFTDLPYKIDDLEILATVGIMPSALVCNRSTGIETVKDITNYPRALTFGVGGYGSSEHLSTEVLLTKLKAKYTIVPYAQGGSTSVTDLIGGHIDCMFANFPTIRQHLDNPKLKLLLSSHQINFSAPIWETEFKEAFPFSVYLSIIIPKSVDNVVKKQLAIDLSIAFQSQSFKSSLEDLGLFPKASIDVREIQRCLQANEAIRKFILENKIKVSG
jgi:tripartite-type tricarboxylate transporter receptor subunit TctC